jgi:ubiquinone/menaquinone biosynthesis C-methylase UbiE
MINSPMQDWRPFYEKEAKEYDHSRYGGCYGQLFRKLHHETLVHLVRPHAFGRTLDVAAGTGHVTLLLASMGFDVTALDLTEAMIRLAQNKLNEQNLHANFSIGSVLELPFPDESFDLVVSTRFLHLWPYDQQKSVLAEMTRVLAPSGVLIVDFDNWWHKSLLSLPIFIYQRLTGKGRKVGEYYNRFRKTILMLESLEIRINDIRGVGGYHLFLPAIFSQGLARTLGRINGTTPLRVISEQFILKGQKR